MLALGVAGEAEVEPLVAHDGEDLGVGERAAGVRALPGHLPAAPEGEVRSALAVRVAVDRDALARVGSASRA